MAMCDTFLAKHLGNSIKWLRGFKNWKIARKFHDSHNKNEESTWFKIYSRSFSEKKKKSICYCI